MCGGKRNCSLCQCLFEGAEEIVFALDFENVLDLSKCAYVSAFRGDCVGARI